MDKHAKKWIKHLKFSNIVENRRNKNGTDEKTFILGDFF
jgi:hypothetical protein